MVGPIAVDTPDYQRGIVSAQKQLAFLDQTSDVVTVGVPPNAETLVVATPTNSLLSTPVCLGLTTALNYPAVRIGGFLGALGAIHWMFDISSALDAQVQIKWAGADLEQWWVYADSGVRLTVNPTQTSNQLGQQYVIPTVPSTVTGDHPPNELQTASSVFNAPTSATIIGAPGAGRRVRLFSASLFATSNWCVLGDGSGESFTGVSQGGSAVWTPHPQGIPTSTNQPVGITNQGAAGTTGVCVVQYTIETV